MKVDEVLRNELADPEFFEIKHPIDGSSRVENPIDGRSVRHLIHQVINGRSQEHHSIDGDHYGRTERSPEVLSNFMDGVKKSNAA